MYIVFIFFIYAVWMDASRLQTRYTLKCVYMYYIDKLLNYSRHAVITVYIQS